MRTAALRSARACTRRDRQAEHFSDLSCRHHVIPRQPTTVSLPYSHVLAHRLRPPVLAVIDTPAAHATDQAKRHPPLPPSPVLALPHRLLVEHPAGSNLKEPTAFPARALRTRLDGSRPPAPHACWWGWVVEIRPAWESPVRAGNAKSADDHLAAPPQRLASVQAARTCSTASASARRRWRCESFSLSTPSHDMPSVALRASTRSGEFASAGTHATDCVRAAPD